jgi:hypothetical protein
MRIALFDLASGTKRVLESSMSPVKVGAAVETITDNEWHTWYYEGWSWSPDGSQPAPPEGPSDPAHGGRRRYRHGDRAAI